MRECGGREGMWQGFDSEYRCNGGQLYAEPVYASFVVCLLDPMDVALDLL
jgi:hypothetical protein